MINQMSGAHGQGCGSLELPNWRYRWQALTKVERSGYITTLL